MFEFSGFTISDSVDLWKGLTPCFGELKNEESDPMVVILVDLVSLVGLVWMVSFTF